MQVRRPQIEPTDHSWFRNARSRAHRGVFTVANVVSAVVCLNQAFRVGHHLPPQSQGTLANLRKIRDHVC